MLAPSALPIWRGDFGVDLFFVLSGFLIAGMLLGERERTGGVALGLFYVRRLLRLWPALLLVVLVEQATDDPHRHMAWANALYVNDFVPVGEVALAWTWSLAIEEQFYLVCPWFLDAVAELDTQARLKVTLGAIAGFVAIAGWVVIAYRMRAPDAEIVGSLDLARWGFDFDVFYDKPWMRAGALLSGVAAAMVYRLPSAMARLSRGGAAVGALVPLALGAMALATHWQLFEGTPRLVEIAYLASFRTVFALSAAFLVLVVLSDHPVGRLLARPLSSRLLFPVAQLAYAAYLINPMVTMAVGRYLVGRTATSAHPMWILLPCDLAGTLGVAAVVHLLVERPGMELRPRHAPPTRGAA